MKFDYCGQLFIQVIENNPMSTYCAYRKGFKIFVTEFDWLYSLDELCKK